MLEIGKPELVAIITEFEKHEAIALNCIAIGCNVIIDKLIALSIAADADAIIKADIEKGVMGCANHQNRFKNLYSIFAKLFGRQIRQIITRSCPHSLES